MTTTTHYATLGLAASATTADIGAAYSRALQDLRTRMASGSPPPPEHLDELRAAYKVLNNPASRSSYDATLGVAVPPPVAKTTAQSGADPQSHAFSFSGDGGEYFRIWIVNLLLSVVTLGIYSAWAKVRREKYFHRNLQLDNSGFEYHGEPMAILKGRAIAFGLLIAVGIAKEIGPVFYSVALLALVPVVPWLVVRALRFRAHNSSYRGLRFSFHGDYRGAFVAFIGYGLLSMVTLGLAFPLFYRMQRKYILDNLRYGTAEFSCDASAGSFYGIFLKPILGTIAFFVVLGFLAAIGGKAMMAAMTTIGIVAYVAFLLVVVPYFRVRVTNLVWNHTHVADGNFTSALTVWEFFKLTTVNLILTIVTLGLFWPWAKVRMARHRASYLSLQMSTPLDDFVAGETTKAAALGDAMSDAFDMDVAL